MHWFIAANDPVTYEGEQLERDLKYLPFRYKYKYKYLQVQIFIYLWWLFVTKLKLMWFGWNNDFYSKRYDFKGCLSTNTFPFNHNLTFL